jgi:hypothetical protein
MEQLPKDCSTENQLPSAGPSGFRFENDRRRAAAARCASAAIFVLGLAGCSGQLNQSDALLGSALPDLEGRPVGALPANETASLNAASVDRSHWSPTVILVERRQVEAFPPYVSDVLRLEGTARERGEWPTTGSVLEGSGCQKTAVAHAVAEPFVAAFDLVAMPFRMFSTPPLSTVRFPANPSGLIATHRGAARAGEAGQPAGKPAEKPAGEPAGQ